MCGGGPLKTFYPHLYSGKKYRVEYEFIHSVCFKCGTVGHRSDLCREQTSRGTMAESPQPLHPVPVRVTTCCGEASDNGNFGRGVRDETSGSKSKEGRKMMVSGLRCWSKAGKIKLG